MTDAAHDRLIGQLYVALQIDQVSKEGKQVKAGAHFADGMLFLVGHPLCRLPGQFREAAVDLAVAARAEAIEHRPRRRGTAFSPADGLKHAKNPAPVFCAVIRHRLEPDTYAWLRVALLEVALADLVRAATPERAPPRSPLKVDDVAVLQTLLYEPLLELGGDALYELIQALGSRLAEQQLDGSAEPEIPDAALTELPMANREPIRQALRNAFAHVTGAARARRAPETEAPPAPARIARPRPAKPPVHARPLLDPTGTFEIPKAVQALRSKDPLAPPVSEFVDPPILAFATTPSDVAADEGEDEHDPVPDPSNAKAESGRRDAGTRYALYLSGSLQPEVQRTLTPPEYRKFMAYALRICPNGSNVTWYQAAPWMILLLSGLTSRHHLVVQQAMVEWLEGRFDTSDGFWIDATGFWSRMPLAPDPDRKSESAPSPVIHLTWPLPIVELLGRVSEASADWIRVLDCDLTDSIHQASQAVRAQLNRRFSLRRLRNSLAPAVYIGTGDEAMAQVVAGDALHHSDAPLHYYSQRVGRIRRGFAWALADWVPSDWKWVVLSQPDDDEIFGMPRACLPDADVLRVISELATRADQAPPPRADTRELCDAHDRLTAYVVAMFAASTTHRFTEHLKCLMRRHLLLRWTGSAFGLAIFTDKYTVNALSCRGAVIAAMLVQQLEIYFAHLGRLLRRLEQHPRRNRNAIEALKAAIEGQGTLFLRFEHDNEERGTTRVRPFESDDLRQLWPEWQFPAYVLRHRFASFHWRQSGISRDDVMRQMGHASDGVHFDEGDPDSVLRFASRVAEPLNRALADEGWRPVRSWMPERLVVPPMPADTCAPIMAEQAALTDQHRKLQRDATARAMGRGQVVERPDALIAESSRIAIIETARELARTGLDNWLAHADQAPLVAIKALGVDDVARLTDAVTATLPDRRYWVPATNVLRNRLQRLRQEQGWTLQLPPAIFVLDVAEPVITPACVRAFNHCSALLQRCERAIVHIGLSPTPDRQRWLGITAMLLAIRCGVVRRERLIEVLAHASSATRHPALVDTLLVPVDEPVAERRDELDEEATETDEESSAQYVTVQGLAAVCLQRWASISAAPDKATLQEELIGALGSLLNEGPHRSSTIHDVDEFLAVAQLARRLTMPGLRAAWESGQLPSRTVQLERQMDAWMGAIRRQVKDGTTGVDAADDTRLIDRTTATADVLETVRACICIQEKEKGQPRAAKTVADEVAVIVTRWPQITLTATWITQYVVRRLDKIRSRGERATLYQDYTNFLAPFLVELAGQELSDLNSIEQTELFERVIADRVTDGKRALKVVRGIVREMAADGIEGPDLHVLAASAGARQPAAKAYLVSCKEHEWIREQLARWVSEARSSADTSPRLAFEYEAARVVWELQFWIGLRTSENLDLRHAEVIDIDGELILLIRRIRRRGMKTSASVRPIRLRHFLPPDVLTRFKRFLEAQRAAFARGDRTVGIFAPPSGDGRIANSRRIVSALTRAMQLILPKGEGRPYSGRHVRASYGLHAILPEEHRSPSWKLEDAPDLPRYLMSMPLRFILRFWSRALGHATTRSSLTFYSHSIADLSGLERGWPEPTLAVLGCAAGIKPMTLGSRVSRAGLSADSREQLVGMLLDDRAGRRDASAEPVPGFESLDQVIGRDGSGHSLIRLADVAREWLRGDRLSILQHRHGIGADWLQSFARALERIDHRYRAGIVDRGVGLDGIDPKRLSKPKGPSARRGPRRRLLIELASEFDRLQSKRPQVWHRYCALIADQRENLGCIEFNGADAVVVEEVRGALASAGLVFDRVNARADSGRPVPESRDSSTMNRSRELGLLNLIILARAAVSAGFS